MIPYKEKNSEFEIQAYVYNQLLKLGYNVRGSVPNARKRDRGDIPRMIFDLVIFNEKEEPMEIIEVKDCMSKAK